MSNIASVSLLVVALIGVSGCSVDNKAQIAMKTLYQDDRGSIVPSTMNRSFPALTGALNARFPAGCAPDGLQRYISSLDGSCAMQNAEHSLLCGFVESSSFCIKTSISVVANIDSAKKITDIEAWHVLEGC
jgi:hypothetical protein